MFRYNQQKYYIFNPGASNPGLSLNDKLLLPYPTVLGFEFLLNAITKEQNDLLDYMLQTKITSTFDKIYSNISQQITDVYSCDRCLLQNPQTCIKCAELQLVNSTLLDVEKDLQTYVDEAPAGSTILKTFMCSIGSISPFWETDPVSACKFLNHRFNRITV